MSESSRKSGQIKQGHRKLLEYCGQQRKCSLFENLTHVESDQNDFSRCLKKRWKSRVTCPQEAMSEFTMPFFFHVTFQFIYDVFPHQLGGS